MALMAWGVAEIVVEVHAEGEVPARMAVASAAGLVVDDIGESPWVVVFVAASVAELVDGDIEEEPQSVAFLVLRIGDAVEGKHQAEDGVEEVVMRAEDDVAVMVFGARPVHLWETMSGLAYDQPEHGSRRYCSVSSLFVLWGRWG